MFQQIALGTAFPVSQVPAQRLDPAKCRHVRSGWELLIEALLLKQFIQYSLSLGSWTVSAAQPVYSNLLG